MSLNDTIVDVIDIEKEIEAKIVTALRFLFSIDKRFTYSDDDNETRISITTDYTEDESPLSLPQIVVNGIIYGFDMGTTMFQNYANPIFDESGQKIGNKYLNTINFSYQVSCYGENYVSRELANAALNYITFVGAPVFNHFNIRTLRADKGNTTPTSQFPKIFHTALAVSGIFEWQGTVTAIDKSKLHYLEETKLKHNK